VRTVPAHLADLAVLELDDDERNMVARFGMQVGSAVEVDLDALAAVRSDLAGRVGRYAKACQRFAVAADGPYVTVRHNLVAVRQQDNAAGRVDLVAELEALCAMPGVGPYVDELTSSAYNPDTLDTLGAPLQGTVKVDGNVTVATLTVTGSHPWSVHLGGARSDHEVARIITLTVSHAPWRDRRGRRLTYLTVDAVEVLPDPAVLLPGSGASAGSES
jgi:hypothetical protein